MTKTGAKAELILKNDGIYLSVEKRTPDELLNRAEIMQWFDNYQIKDINFDSVFQLFKSGRLNEEILITSNINILSRSEDIQITISPDNMKASIELVRPGLGGDMLSVKDVIARLRDRGVIYGINPTSIESCLEKRDYGIRIKIADGTEPISGKEGYLAYKFDKDYNNKPKIAEDGSVDYHTVHFFEPCKKDQLLIELVPSTLGSNGVNVLGGFVMPSIKPMPKIPLGKNTRLSEDGLALYAAIDGHIILKGGGVEVSPVLEIKRDVGIETGDISFNGSVIIRGGVASGFSISAAEGIEVFGTVEGATLISSGDIVLYKGVQGAGKAVIMADKRVVSSFIERATIFAGSDIVVNSLLMCSVKCYGNVLAEGKVGAIVGGYCYSQGNITANSLGSAAGTVTKLVAGSSPELIERIESIRDNLNTAKRQFEASKTIVDTLAKQNQENSLNIAKKTFLIAQIREKSKHRDAVIEMTEKLAQAISELSTGNVKLVAKKKLFIGVAIYIGSASEINDDIRGATVITREGDRIVFT